MTERDIFTAARKITDSTNRTAFLAEVCANDPALRVRIERLLRASSTSDSLLDLPAIVPMNSARADTCEHRPDVQADATASNDSDAESFPFLSASSQPDSLGRIGHYEVLEVLGRGGFGIVFRAFDTVLHRIVAVKVLAPELATTSPARKRFLREARSSAKIRHQNVVQVYAVEEQPIPYLVMEFIPGETLQQRLDRIGPLEVADVVRIGRAIAEGLAAAHALGLIHRDVKPSNVLIEDGLHQQVKLTDFSLAMAADDASLTQSGCVAGTPMYMSPEQAQGEQLDHRTDLFSLGSVLYTICSGRPPFRAANSMAVLKRVTEDTPRPLREVIPETPDWVCDIISRLHAKKHDERFQSAQEVAELLARCEAALRQPTTVPDMKFAARAPADSPEPNTVVLRETTRADSSSRRDPLPRRGFRVHSWSVAVALVLLLLAGMGVTEATGVTKIRGTVVRLFTAEGTLVVETDDPDVSISVEGEEVSIAGAGVKELRVKPGQYKVQASKDGKVVSQQLVSVTKNGKEVVRIRREPPSTKQEELAPPIIDPDRKAAEWALSNGGNAVLILLMDGKELTLENSHIRKDAIDDLPKAPFELIHLNVNRNPNVTDEGLKVLKGLRHLNFLQLSNTDMTDVALPYFQDCKKLESLKLHNTGVTDAGLPHLANFTNLKILTLKQTRISEKAVKQLAAALPECRIEWKGGVIEPTK